MRVIEKNNRFYYKAKKDYYFAIYFFDYNFSIPIPESKYKL